MNKRKSTKKKLDSKKISKPVIKEVSLVTKNIAKPAVHHFNAWSLSIYVYWFIILFFISATFYILGRSHGILHPIANNVEITEEALLQPSQYLDSGRSNLLAGR